YFIGEIARQKDRRFRDPKICRPFFGLVYAAHQRRVFLWREVGVKSGAKLRIHDYDPQALLAI
ncbi:MAG: hypothetical protein DME50_16280, partial [Verrucomicrobia bacterium]